MKALAVIDTLTTMNDLKGGNNCPIAFMVDVFEEEKFFSGDANPKTKNIFLKPDELILGSGISLHGITNEDISYGNFEPLFELGEGLEKIYTILSVFSKNMFYVAGYGVESFDLKVLNENFKRVLGKEPIVFDKKHIIDVERLSKLLVDVRKCGNYSQSSVMAAESYSDYVGLLGISQERRSINMTEALLGRLVRNHEIGNSLEEISDFISKPHDVEVFQSGKYKGMKIEEVYNIDRQYFTWILKNRGFYENDPDMIEKVKSIINREE